MYRITEIFQTWQGEGARTGEASTFVRFTGCNLWNGDPNSRSSGKGACAQWCDSDFAKGIRYESESEVAAAMHAVWSERFTEVPQAGRWCVITGGEPLLQLDAELIDHLHAEGWKVAVETNGTLFNSVLDIVDWVCVSPKFLSDGSVPVLEVAKGDELKVVLPGGDPGWTQPQLDTLREQTSFTNYFVQPQDPIEKTAVNVSYLVGGLATAHSSYEARRKHCYSFVESNPEWQLSIQTHKIAGVR